MQQLYRAAGDVDLGFLELAAPDAVWTYPAVEGIGWSGRWRGREEIACWATLHDEEEPILDLRPHEYVAQGDRVVVLGFARMRATPTRREWETAFAHAVRIRDGRIDRFEAYFDTAACMEAHSLLTTGPGPAVPNAEPAEG
ncbi:MAG: nuclear transport factor 2 family protein [Gaiellaceae bacterium]